MCSAVINTFVLFSCFMSSKISENASVSGLFCTHMSILIRLIPTPKQWLVVQQESPFILQVRQHIGGGHNMNDMYMYNAKQQPSQTMTCICNLHEGCLFVN